MPQSQGPCLSYEPRGSRSYRKFSPTALTAFLPAVLSPLPALRAGREDVLSPSTSGLACSSEQLGPERAALAEGSSKVWQLPVVAGPALLPRGPCYFVGARISLCTPPPPPVPEADLHECVRLVSEQRVLAAPCLTQEVLQAPALVRACQSSQEAPWP